MTTHTDYRPAPVAKAVLLGGILTGAVIVVGALMLTDPMTYLGFDDHEREHIRAGAEFPELEIDADELADARRNFAGDTNLELLDEELDKLFDTAIDMNKAQFGDDVREVERTGIQLLEKLGYRANDVVVATGPKGFQVAADPLFENCQLGLDELLGAIRAGELELAEAIDAPPDEQFEAYRRYCGDLLPLLVNRNIIDENAEFTHPDAMALIDVFQRYRWVHYMIGDKYPLHMMLSPTELEVFFRWRIEDPNAFSPEQRHQFLQDALPYLPSEYPAPLAEARIDASTLDDDDEILQRFDQLVDQHPDEPLFEAVRDNLR